LRTNKLNMNQISAPYRGGRPRTRPKSIGAELPALVAPPRVSGS
jgi:hypothetical protein